AKGIVQAAVLKRASYKDILVPSPSVAQLENKDFAKFSTDVPRSSLTIATSSTRRKAQWLNRYPGDHIESLRGNVNTRLRKLTESNW
ncbi:hypothetical protein J8H89_08460, partial [Campylobacter jejuni]|nr:hypothetical protein [Campylobacter jejuni]